MKNLIQKIVLIMSIWGAGISASQAYDQPLVDNKKYRWGKVLQSINSNTSKKIELWKLQFHTKDFGWIDSDELYLVQLTKRKFEEVTRVNIPKIILTVTGHSSTLKTMDLDQDGNEEILFTYHAGANQTILRVFLHAEVDLVEAKGQIVVSNMASIEFIKSGGGYKIVFENSENINGDRKLIKEILRLEKGELVK